MKKQITVTVYEGIIENVEIPAALSHLGVTVKVIDIDDHAEDRVAEKVWD